MNTNHRDTTDKIIYDLLSGKINITPGQMLNIARDVLNIPRSELAEQIMLTDTELDDIEHNRRPFPAILLGLIFIHGLRQWYYGQSLD